MANKIEIDKLDSISANDAAAVASINRNFEKVQEAINNSISRDGTVPNFMDADFDLNTHRIINGAEPVDDGDMITLKYFKENVGESANNAAAAEQAALRAASSAQSASISANNALSSAQSAANTVNGFDAHVEDKKTEFDGHVADKTAEFDTHAAQKQAQVDASANAAKQSETNAAKTASDFDAHAAEKQNAFNQNAQSKTDTFNTNAAQKQAQVDASAENARKWAVGTQEERPEGSSKYWAEYAKSITDGTLNETMITNCITKIPQDIKLELSNGTLTLKAGSKVYIPNGVGVFDEVVIDTDKTITSTFNITAILFLQNTGNLRVFGLSQVFSGDTAPSGQQYMLWYDTSTNKIKLTENSGSTWIEGQSFPLGVINISLTQITSIDKVFNGFSYIGSTIFALPGVEGLIPNGRNADGSLNNTKFTITNVLTRTFQSTSTYSGALIFANNALAAWGESDYSYDEEENFVKFRGDNYPGTRIGNISLSSGRITSFIPKNVFTAVDRNDTEWASTASKPSNRYVDLTLQANGAKYIAPANGRFQYSTATTGDSWMVMVNHTSKVEVQSSSLSTSGTVRTYIPAKKDDEVSIYYILSGTSSSSFRFIYDEGVK